MHPKKVLSCLWFLDEVISKKQTYYVYEGPEQYVLVTVNKERATYNFNVVSEEAYEYVKRLFAGKSRITGADVLKASKKPALMKNRFDALNTLYALCASGAAKTDTRYKSNTLFFNVHKLK